MSLYSELIPKCVKPWKESVEIGIRVWYWQREIFDFLKVCYGLKSASEVFRAYLTHKLDEIRFESLIDDPDMWIQLTLKPIGKEY